MAKVVRAISIKNVYGKVFRTFDHFTADMQSVFGTPERDGFWLVYGKEKNGKTRASLMLANLLSKKVTVAYISAEEGISMHFRDTMERLGISHKNRRLKLYEYLSLEEIEVLLKRTRGRPSVIFLDNMTVYADELKGGHIRRLQQDYPQVLFVFVAHEDKNGPYTAQAKLVQKLAKVIIRVEGLRAFVSGRVPGGEFDIDDEKAELYFGTK